MEETAHADDTETGDSVDSTFITAGFTESATRSEFIVPDEIWYGHNSFHAQRVG